MIVAADTGNSFSDPLTWVNFGVLGLVLVGAILGFIWFKPSVDKVLEERDRLVAERDKLADQRDAMAQVLQDRLLPVVGDFISTTRALLPVLQDIQQLQHLTPLLHELMRVQDELIRRGESRGRQTPPRSQRRKRSSED